MGRSERQGDMVRERDKTRDALPRAARVASLRSSKGLPLLGAANAGKNQSL